MGVRSHDFKWQVFNHRWWPLDCHEAGCEGRPIAVDVGGERDPHGSDPRWPGGNVSLSLTVVKCFELPRAAGRRCEGCVDAHVGPWYPKLTPHFLRLGQHSVPIRRTPGWRSSIGSRLNGRWHERKTGQDFMVGPFTEVAPGGSTDALK